MPRASRYLLDGYTYHLTHRCHDKRFLLKFSEEREKYREWLREGINRYDVSVYGYCITHNHVHIIAHADDRSSVARMMQLPSAAIATHLNKRKNHEGSVWEHPYQCTIIQNDRHLLNCLRYIDLNMVRAGAVKHPDAWRWCGYDELVGQRKRYRLIDTERLIQSLNLNDESDLARLHAEGINEIISRDALERESMWTESLAVGGKNFIESVKAVYQNRSRFKEECISSPDKNSDIWVIREAHDSYMAYLESKSVL